MEGELWKWTNYWNGWQSRWFILDQGILSYYKSLEEVGQGCKGSLNVSACEISLHPTDNLRLDLAIPGEQHMYLRAKTEKLRQQWLIAMGSAKACLSNQSKRRSSQSQADAKELKSHPSSRNTSIKSKEAELRLYCDMLMMHVHNVKEAVKEEGDVDLQKLNEGSYYLSQACDTFISTLDELMRLSLSATSVANVEGVGQGCPTPVQNGVGGIMSTVRAGSVERTLPGMITLANQRRQRCRTTSTDSVLSNLSISALSSCDEYTSVAKNSNKSETVSDGFQSVFGKNHHNVPTKPNGSSPKENVIQKTKNDSFLLSNENPKEIVSSSPVLKQIASHEFRLPFTFPFPIPEPENTSIPTSEFLNSCDDIIKLYDLLDPKSFSPIKIDVLGNLESVRAKFKSDPESFNTLNKIIDTETRDKKAANISSGTAALRWLVRHLKFIHFFWNNFIESGISETIEDQLVKSYMATLYQHHGLVVRSVYSVALKNAPDRWQFFRSLKIPANLSLLEEQQNFFQTRFVPLLAPYLDSVEKCLVGLVEVLEQK